MNAADLGPQDHAELANLYHTAQIALDNPSRHERLCYAARGFHRLHPEVPFQAAYLAVDRTTDLAGDEIPHTTVNRLFTPT